MTLNRLTPQFTIDEEFQKLFPPQTPEEHAALKESILKEGCREPLVIWKEEDILIDGHNRYAICTEYLDKQHIEYQVRELSFADREEAKLWVLANQSGRRNLTGFQKIEVILKFKDTLSSKAKANQQASGGAVRLKSDKPIHTYKMLAQLAGVSHGTIRQAEYILACADEQDIEALRRGTKKINRIYNKYRKPTRSIESTTKQQDNVPPLDTAPSYPDDLIGQIDLIIDALDGIGNEFSQKEYRKYIVGRVREWLKSKTAD